MLNQDNLILAVSDLCVDYDQPVVKNADISVSIGEVVCLLAPIGAGKSTLFRSLLGFERIRCGNINFNCTNTEIGFVFQENNLFPWLTAYENVANIFSLFGKKIDKESLIQRLEEFSLRKYKDFYPKQMSTGMNQLLSVLRVLFLSLKVVFIDESFSNIDEKTKLKLFCDIRTRSNVFGTSFFIITHNISDALFLSDRILIGSCRPLELKYTYFNKLPLLRDNSIVLQQDYGNALAEIHRAVASIWI